MGSGEELFETYVFACDGEKDSGDPNVTDWNELSGERYMTSIEAERGHRLKCLEIAGGQ